MLIYKILRPGEWDAFEAAGRFDGSPDDHRDGFVHLSTREQVGRTALRYFADEPDLVVAIVDADAVTEWLRWEVSSNGDTFPHVYASLPRSAVVSVHHIAGASLVDEQLPRP